MKNHEILKVLFIFIILLINSEINIIKAQADKPLLLGIDGLTHGHVAWVFTHPDTKTFKLVGIAETNKELAQRLSERYGFPIDIVYPSLEEMIRHAKPEAVAAFNSTFEHLHTVKTCAPRGIHVMVEKPLAVNITHAEEMAALAELHNMHLITNYETTWYPSNHYVYREIQSNKIGNLRKIIVNSGHNGPQEIGVNQEFLDWLTNPKLNGGGALTDFGCYGANLISWIKGGERPVSVYAQVNNYKPENYPEVDDDATILLEYGDMVGVIQASWNWPFSRKDMEIYGEGGFIKALDRYNYSYKYAPINPEQSVELEEEPGLNPFDFFKGVVRGDITMESYHPASLENNLLVVEILDAARKSAASNQKIKL